MILSICLLDSSYPVRFPGFESIIARGLTPDYLALVNTRDNS